ncbi:MAG TPA: NTP transferase domain-containing protein [Luteitalea sp.]|nr:NTP transferase domain-containing protein [Luteitalea sp.]
MSAPALVILQARLGSQRLPGKVMAPLAGVPLVEYCLVRLLAAGVGPVVLATTTRPEDAALLAVAERLGVESLTGSVDDVLARFADVVRRHPDAQQILRATADNPFVDIDGPARVLAALGAGADYAVEEGLPLGTAVEGVRRDVLLQAHREAATPYDREHVTPWVRRVDGVVRAMPAAPAIVRAPDLRLTVDTPDDLAYAQRLALSLSGSGDPRLASLTDVIARARQFAALEVA